MPMLPKQLRQSVTGRHSRATSFAGSLACSGQSRVRAQSMASTVASRARMHSATSAVRSPPRACTALVATKTPSHVRAATWAAPLPQRSMAGSMQEAVAPGVAASVLWDGPSVCSEGRWSLTGRTSGRGSAPEGWEEAGTSAASDGDAVNGPPATYGPDVFDCLAAEAERSKVRLWDLFRHVRAISPACFP